MFAIFPFYYWLFVYFRVISGKASNWLVFSLSCTLSEIGILGLQIVKDNLKNLPIQLEAFTALDLDRGKVSWNR